jgi:uncharacterized damage-inducible protein DinB
MELITIAHYSTDAQELLFEFVIARPETWTESLETISQHRTIRTLLAHCVGAEMRWLARIQGKAQPERYESAAPADVNQIHADWREQRDVTLSIIQSADQVELNREIAVSIPAQNYSDNLTIDEIVFHILNHENYHRGQCSMLLQHLAVDPPNFDYTFFKH